MADNHQRLNAWSWAGNRVSRRWLAIFAAIFSLAILLLGFRHADGDMGQWASFLGEYDDGSRPEPFVPSCSSRNETGNRGAWEETKNKYSHLADDKFTVVMQTYRRPQILQAVLKSMLATEIPSLHEIVVVWGDLEATPPPDYQSPHGVAVRFRKAERDSLNSKFLPDADIKTQAVLLSDDDLHGHPQDLEFLFRTWRKFGRYRLTGAPIRCHDVQKHGGGNFSYAFCGRQGRSVDPDAYSMVLTSFSFVHVAFLDYYSRDDATMTRIRDYVDAHFNCEDIALNYIQALLTGDGPLLVNGKHELVIFKPANGISKKPGHMERRTQCVNDFATMLGCMPLVWETTRIERGRGRNGGTRP